MAVGYNKPLYVLPFDHRATFSKTMFGWQGPLSPEQTAEIAAVKQVIYDAFKAAVAGGVPKERAGILVDEQFGAAILRGAREQGFITACPAEKSGQNEFDFEYGEDLARHIEAFHVTFCKVLVRYNPDGIPDAAVDGDGMATIDIAGGTDDVTSVVIQPDGKILAGGYFTIPAPDGSVRMNLARLNPRRHVNRQTRGATEPELRPRLLR